MTDQEMTEQEMIERLARVPSGSIATILSRLAAERDALQKKAATWIDASKQSPDWLHTSSEDGLVPLLVAPQDRRHYPYPVIGYWIANKWRIGPKYGAVTHWMPLPEYEHDTK